MSFLTQVKAYNEMVDIVVLYYVVKYSVIGEGDNMKKLASTEKWKSMVWAVIKDEFDDDYEEFLRFCFYITKCKEAHTNFLKERKHKHRLPSLFQFLETYEV
jgi:hypothetical protein